jgi:hypothetical protein
MADVFLTPFLRTPFLLALEVIGNTINHEVCMVPITSARELETTTARNVEEILDS